MKKILFAAFAASLLAAGCQKTEVYQPANSGEKMTFSTEMRKMTKGTPTDGLDSLKAQGFYLWAYAAFSTENVSNVDQTTRIYDGMNGMMLKYNTTAQSWQPDPNKAYYWPGQNKNLRFFAVSSKDDGIKEKVTNLNKITESGEHVITKEDPSMTIQNYTVLATGDKIAKDDLMVADFLDLNQSSNERKVVLNFRHALSKVEFLFKATNPGNVDNLKVYVQQLKVLGLKNQGTLSVTPVTQNLFSEQVYENPVKLDWGTEESKTGNESFIQKSTAQYADTSYPTIETIKEKNDQNQDVVIFSESVATLIDPEVTATTPLSFAKWLMLPQSIEGKLVEIIYVINGRQFKATFALDKSTTGDSLTELKQWGQNKYIKYTITLAPNIISFDANVSDDWDDETGINHIN